MKDLLDKMKKLNENKNGKVITFDFDNTIVKSFENRNDGMEIQYQLQIIIKLHQFLKTNAKQKYQIKFQHLLTFQTEN